MKGVIELLEQQLKELEAEEHHARQRILGLESELNMCKTKLSDNQSLIKSIEKAISELRAK